MAASRRWLRPKPLLRGPIALRLFLFNCLLVFVPIAGFASFQAYESALLRQQEHAMVQEGRALAAWLGSIQILDEESAVGAVAALGRAHTSRIRIISDRLELLADSSVIAPAPVEPAPQVDKSRYPSSVEESGDRALSKEPESSFLYRVLSVPVRLYRKWVLPPQPPLESADYYGKVKRFDGAEILAALDGRYGSTTRVSSGGQQSITLYSALPIRRGDKVVGAVLVSQSTYRILTELYAFRLDTGRVFLWSLLAALLVSLMLAFTISRPLSRLGDQARRLTERGRADAEPFSGSGRDDEIDRLAAAFTALVRRLDERLDWAERFSADASHELKNPLAGIRASAELLLSGDAAADAAADRPVRTILAACQRMETIVSGLRSLSLLEKPAPDSGGTRVRESLEQLAARWPEAHVRLDLADFPPDAEVACSPERFDCAVSNLIANALSFSPEPGSVRVLALQADGMTELRVEDSGPGIPAESLERVFERFRSFRPGDEAKAHAGLGLALVKAIATHSGGSVRAENRPEGGARFILRFPNKA